MQTVRATHFCVSVILLIFSQVSLIQAQGECQRGQVCIKLRQCDDAVELLSEAETTFDDDRKNHIIDLLRDRVCGRRTDRTVCCAQESSSSAESDDNGLRKLGSFRNIFHDIAGDAYAVDSNTILIKGFTYDGEGPDTFFLAGTSGKPNSRGEYVLPWPADGQVYGYNDDIPLIKRSFDGSEDLTLKLPPGASTDDIKWLSVWCRRFDVNFGHVNVV